MSILGEIGRVRSNVEVSSSFANIETTMDGSSSEESKKEGLVFEEASRVPYAPVKNRSEPKHDFFVVTPDATIPTSPTYYVCARRSQQLW